MAATETRNAKSGGFPVLSRLAAACRDALAQSVRRQEPRKAKSRQRPSASGAALQALCLSALTLPGMVSQALADNADDDVGFEYSHYEENTRPFTYYNNQTNSNVTIGSPLKPITVDGQHAYTRFHLADRVRFGLNFTEDVWSGATPWFTAPVSPNYSAPGPRSKGISSGASYGFDTAGGSLFLNGQGQILQKALAHTPYGSLPTSLAPDKLTQVLAYASPEIRDQTDFKLGYDWDNASLEGGGGASIERDYLSRFGNLGLRMDFNQKRTTVNLGGSYTNSDTHATLDAGEYGYMKPMPGDVEPITITSLSNAIPPHHEMNMLANLNVVRGNRQDSAVTLALSQVMSKNGVLTAGFGYTQSSGYLSNPYKAELAYVADTTWRTDGSFSSVPVPNNVLPGATRISPFGSTVFEQRPTLRNQFTLDTSYRHFIEPLDAAAKLGYSFFHDDWGITAHTFDAEWRQALGSSWSLTPHIRYYSQTAANFYAPFIVQTVANDNNGNTTILSPFQRYFSSDQRLAAFGALSGGISISKQFAKGLSLDMGFEYYTHASALQLGGGSDGGYNDFQYYVANAGLRANLGKLALTRALYEGGDFSTWLAGLFADNPADAADPHAAHRKGHQHGNAPAGVMFSHMLDKAGDYMLGYRYMRDIQGGNFLSGDSQVSTQQVTRWGCPLDWGPAHPRHSTGCNMQSIGMIMNMHMLDLMYAPSDWLTLMLMPQFMDMSMDMSMQYMGATHGMGEMPMRNYQASGGIGDTSAYAMFRLWEQGSHHLHITQGLSAPTGSVSTHAGFFNGYIYPYDMQNGSGTWDYKPSLTYTGHDDDWFWGGQVNATIRTTRNAEGYKLGDIIQGTAWGGYQLTSWLSGTVRGLYTAQGGISGKDSFTNVYNSAGDNHDYTMPDYSPQNYGGSNVDLGLGFNIAIPHGVLAGHHFGFEWRQPMYTYANGYQLDRTGSLSATWGVGF